MMRKTFGPSAFPTRRALLRGLGATLALPFLPSALPRSAWGTTPKAPIRLVVAVMPNGIYTPFFQPQNAGAGYDLPPILQPIAALQSRISVLSGVHNACEMEAFDEHSPAMGPLLNDTAYNDSCLATGISFDQVAADAFGSNTPFRSLQLTVQNQGGGGSPCTNNISWGSGSTPFPPMDDPRAAFDRLFAVEDGLSEREIEARKAIRASVLDRVRERTVSLKSRLNTEDQARLDQYETGLRELEARLDQLDAITCEPPVRPQASPGFPEATALQYDLVHKAFECDLTRYVTFLQGPSVSDEVYAHVGANSGLHNLSHAGWTSDNSRDEYVACNTWQLEAFAALLDKLATTTDVDGSDMLSNTICVFTTEFSESNMHMGYGPPYSLPIAIAGGENAGIVQGQHRVFQNENLGNLWLGVLKYLGVDQPTFGEHGTDPIELG